MSDPRLPRNAQQALGRAIGWVIAVLLIAVVILALIALAAFLFRAITGTL